MYQVLWKEINSFLNSLAAYVVLAVFLLLTGLFTWVFPQTSVLAYGYANLDPLFTIAPYVFMFLIPAVTMRTFAEEKKAGTMELLLTRPLTDWQVVVGKYLACLLLVLLALLPTLLYYYTVHQLGSPQGNLDSAAIVGSYVGLICLAATFTAVGMVASAVTDSQIVAFILAMFFCYVLYEGFTSVATIDLPASYAYLIGQLGIDFHYRAISRGLIDSRNLVYFLSLTLLMLHLSKLIVGARKW